MAKLSENGGSIAAITDTEAKGDTEFSSEKFRTEDMFEKVTHDVGELVPEKKDWRYFWRRVIADMKNKDLIPVKILFFFKYATLFVLYPFLTLQMKSLGLIEWEIGVNQATIPIVAILGPPVAGIIADRIGNFKFVLAVITAANSGLALLLLLVPVAREIVPLPTRMTFELGCGMSSMSNLNSSPPFVLTAVDSSMCSLDNADSIFALPSSVVQCGTVCPIGEKENVQNYQSSPYIKKLTSLPISPLSESTYLLPNEEWTFLPSSDQKPDFVCDGNKKKCFLGLQYITEELGSGGGSGYETTEDQTATTIIPELVATTTDIEIKLLKYLPKGDVEAGGSLSLNVTQPVFQIDGEFTFNGRVYSEPTCANPPDIDDFRNCSTKCFVQYERQLFCTNLKVQKVYSVGLTFGLYTLFRILLGISSATSFIMFEGAVLAILKEYGGDYGLQRVSATFAAVLAAPLSGALIYAYDFRPAFYLYALLQLVSAFLTLRIDLEFKKPAEKVLSHLKEVLSQLEILIFFFAMLCSGTAWGYLETFLFLYLKDLGGSEILMGLTISIGGVAGLPLLIFSRPIIKRIGHVNVLSLGLIVYCVRLFGYSFIQNPWSCLFFEAMEAITVSLAITAAATYAVALSTIQTIASVQGIMGGLYFGIGRGAGSFIGGFLIKWYGQRVTYQIFGIGSFVAGMLYFIANITYIRTHTKAGSGLDINNLNGSKPNREQNIVEAHNPAALHYSKDPENGKASNGGNGVLTQNFDGGFLGPMDINKFTDIPLDEEVVSQNGTNCDKDSFDENKKNRKF